MSELRKAHIDAVHIAGLRQAVQERDDEITKLKEKLEAVYDAGMWGIEHVAMANYAHRELEAKQKLREAAK